MKMKNVTIKISDDCELVQIGEGKWVQRKRKIGTLPRTWEEFCEMHPIKEDEYFLDPGNRIKAFGKLPDELRNRDPHYNGDILPNKETAEAFLAMMQLIQLRNCYNGDWKPDWTDGTQKWVIAPCRDNMQIHCVEMSSRVLSFKAKDICGQFFENFRDLIEIAKPLI